MKCFDWNFELKGLIDWRKGDATRVDQSCAKSVPGSGTMWSAYLRLLETHNGEVIKDRETVPGE